MPAARPGLLACTLVVFAVVLAGCAASAPAAEPSPTPTPLGETVVELSVDGPVITGTGPTDPYPGVEFPLREGTRSVTIDIACEGGGPFRVEVGDSMMLGQAPLRGTCDGTTSLTWPVTAKTGPTLYVWVLDGVQWSAAPHFSTAEFVRDDAVTAECEAFSKVYSTLLNADIGLTEYQAFEEAEWSSRVDTAAAELATLVASSETAMAESFASLLAVVRSDDLAPGTVSGDSRPIDPINDICATNHSPLILTAEFGG